MDAQGIQAALLQCAARLAKPRMGGKTLLVLVKELNTLQKQACSPEMIDMAEALLRTATRKRPTLANRPCTRARRTTSLCGQ